MHITFKPFSPTVSESERTISTPLDRPPTASLASLALGGESLNGWDGVLCTLVNKTPLLGVAPQEDDDDEPQNPGTHPGFHDVHGAHQGTTGPNPVPYRLS